MVWLVCCVACGEKGMDDLVTGICHRQGVGLRGHVATVADEDDMSEQAYRVQLDSTFALNKHSVLLLYPVS